MSKQSLSLGGTFRAKVSAKAAKKPSAAQPMFDSLEGRRLMTVGPATIANATVNDSVYDANTGDLHVTFFDTQTKTLNYQQFHGDGTSDAPVQIDAGTDTGQFQSLVEDSNGILHVAYYDGVNGDLKYARRETNGTWSTSIIESKNTVGLYPSIVIGANSQPAVAYYAKTGGNLKLAEFNGSTWSTTLIDTTDDVGRYPSLALNPVTNKLAIAFENSTVGTFRYAQQGTGSTWSALTVDPNTKSGGGYISLSFQGGNPGFSYYDAFNSDLKFAERSSLGKWTVSVVAAKNSQGLYTDLQYTFDTNQPAIVYYNKTNDSAVLAYRSPAGVWTYENQTTAGGRNVTATDGLSINGSVPDLFLVYTDTATGSLIVDTF